jgi:predicted nucleic acid-binding protein
LLSRQFNVDQARRKLLNFKTLVTVLPVTEKTVELALSSEFKDFEDALQYYTAIENNIQTLLTRNLRDYKHATISVMTAEDFVQVS